jgi:Spy/CpxP family protein refolding chaperone
MKSALQRAALGIGATMVALGLAGGAYLHAQNTPAPSAGAGRFGGPGFGRGGPGGPGGILGPAFQRLNLTDAQQARVKEILASHRTDMQTLGSKAMTAHQALDTAIAGTTFDEATVRMKAADAATVDADMAVMRARVYNEVYQLLTPDQQSQLKQIQADMQQRMAQRGAHRGQKQQ